MRTFLTILILFFTFQTWAKADDIRDFEIENMSLYDSALNYFSKKKIKQGKLSTKSGYKKAIVTLKKGQSIDLTTGI